MLSPGELEALDNFRFEHRMPSRAAAVRELFRRGLREATGADGASHRKSVDYGVLDGKSGGGAST
jgi:hypothetical protein